MSFATPSTLHFEAWAASMSDLRPFPVNGVPAAFGLFEVGTPIAVTTHFGSHAPDGNFYHAILFTNAERTEVLVYNRLLLAVD